MAASTKKRPRRYHTPGVVSGNLARELNHQELERRLETSGQLALGLAFHLPYASRESSSILSSLHTLSTIRNIF